MSTAMRFTPHLLPYSLAVDNINHMPTQHTRMLTKWSHAQPPHPPTRGKTKHCVWQAKASTTKKVLNNMAEGGAVPMKEEEVPITTLSDLSLEDAVRQKLEASKELNILIVGCYQVGKSALINALFYKKRWKVQKESRRRLTSRLHQRCQTFPP